MEGVGVRNCSSTKMSKEAGFPLLGPSGKFQEEEERAIDLEGGALACFRLAGGERPGLRAGVRDRSVFFLGEGEEGGIGSRSEGFLAVKGKKMLGKQ